MADIQAVAVALVRLYNGNIHHELTRILQEDLGIDVVVIQADDLEDDRLLTVETVADLEKSMSEAQKRTVAVSPAPAPPNLKPFVPRKIGKPRGFPPNMRRRK